MKTVQVKFTREGTNFGKKESTSYLTNGVLNVVDGFLLFTYFDIELKRKVQIIYNGKTEVIVKSINNLIFTLGKDNFCNYKTEFGTIIVKTQTKYIKWEKDFFMISYSLYASENWIGSFAIRIDFLKQRLKQVFYN